MKNYNKNIFIDKDNFNLVIIQKVKSSTMKTKLIFIFILFYYFCSVF